MRQKRERLRFYTFPEIERVYDAVRKGYFDLSVRSNYRSLYVLYLFSRGKIARSMPHYELYFDFFSWKDSATHLACVVYTQPLTCFSSNKKESYKIIKSLKRINDKSFNVVKTQLKRVDSAVPVEGAKFVYSVSYRVEELLMPYVMFNISTRKYEVELNNLYKKMRKLISEVEKEQTSFITELDMLTDKIYKDYKKQIRKSLKGKGTKYIKKVSLSDEVDSALQSIGRGFVSDSYVLLKKRFKEMGEKFNISSVIFRIYADILDDLLSLSRKIYRERYE